jgi:hypothetical protein
MPARTVALTLLFAALTAGVAAAEPVRLCAPPQPRPYDFCQKGAMLDESSIDDCRARARAGKPGPPRLIVDGTSVPLSATTWTCVELPDRRARLQVANGRRTVGSWKLDPRATCASKVFRVVGPNFYGAMYTTCAKRGSPAVRAAAGT